MNFRKATASGDNGSCVQVARDDETVVLRDSKDPDGPRLRFTPEEWAAFLDGVRKNEFAFEVLS